MPTIDQPEAAPPTSRLRLTYEDYVAMSADKRYELIDGELYMPPAPNEGHQSAVGVLYGSAAYHVRKKRLGKVYVAPFDVVLSEHDTVQPDVIFVSNARRGIITPDNIRGAPDWVAEVLSPGSAVRDYRAKKKLYAESGVREYWIIDPVARAVDIYLLEGAAYRLAERVCETGNATSRVIEGFSVSLADLFEE
ncbi:MAG: Uma2 family endonuclease [Planctomycetes bacterium]|nr:Uma2 family endonuclease [Planctomycetota bacterium]